MAEYGNYILSDRIARGGMAEIFLAKYLTAKGDEHICAIKRILPHYAQEKDYINMFRGEASICKQLRHPNIVQVYNFTKVDDSYAIIMELVNGTDLRALLAACEKANTRLSVPMAVYIAAHIARGLQYAHTKVDDNSGKPLEIVHRDISPQNVLVSYEGNIKLIDFGIAKSDVQNQETKPGVVKGKYSYMSPEQVSAKALDARTDVFSLSIVLWEVLGMKRLFAGETEVETIKNVQGCIIKKSLPELNSEVDEQLLQIVLKGLEKNRRKRYQSAAEFEHDLIDYLNSKYPSFDSGDLGRFVKQIFSEKLAKTQETIDKLRATVAGDSTAAVAGTSIISSAANQSPMGLEKLGSAQDMSSIPVSIKHHKFDVTKSPTQPTHTSFNKPVNTSSALRKTNPLRSRPSPISRHKVANVTNERFIMTSLIVAILAFGFYINKKTNSAKGAMQILLTSNPNTVMVDVNGKKVTAETGGPDENHYLRTPKRFSLGAGKHKMVVKHPGYLPQVIEVEGRPGDMLESGNISLRKNPSVPWGPISFQTNSKKKIFISLGSGYFRGHIPRLLDRVPLESDYKLEIFPNYPSNNGYFNCKFSPTLRKRRQPYKVYLKLDPNPQKSRCLIIR